MLFMEAQHSTLYHRWYAWPSGCHMADGLPLERVLGSVTDMAYNYISLNHNLSQIGKLTILGTHRGMCV